MKPLQIFRGQGAPFWIDVKSKGAITPLGSTYDAATLTLRVKSTDAPTYNWSTTSGVLALEANRIRVTLGNAANTLAPGSYLAQAGLRRASDSNWQFSKVFFCDILEEVVSKP